ncbi:MAG: hypothetical protein IKI97_02655 [Clostridia bacterium]|nr:hypothetical protein [Clostridia bacterium]
MSFISSLKNLFTKKAPKVSCPKCLNLHDINSECRCPNCGLKYKLPDNYLSYLEKAQTKNTQPTEDTSPNKAELGDDKENNLRKVSENKKRIYNERILKFSFAVVTFSLVFVVLMTVFFKDKNALLFKTGEYENQPFFYTTQDGTLNCFFPNDKGCSIGIGRIDTYLSSADGKCVYLTYTGAFGSSDISNYVLRISNYGKKVEKIAECKEYIPYIVAGGDNKYLYIMTPKDDTESLFDLSLTIDGKKAQIIAKNARELAVSTSGRLALVSIDDNGATKLMVYNASNNSLENPGIKNAHPLSIDNKGEYMIYARKNTANSTDIIVEKSTTERVEIPILTDTVLDRIVFSQDRRSLAIIYTNRTVFYTCGDKDYSISTTSGNSVFGYDFNENVSHNILRFREIPMICNVYGKNLLPYCYYDKEHKFVYRITESGAKENVFDTHTIEHLKVSENNRAAFVSNGILYTGKLDKKGNDICRIMNFSGKNLVDISPDGKLVYYTDSDGNMFTAEYGKENTAPRKITVEPDVVTYSEKGANLLVISDGITTLIDKKGKAKKLCDSIETDLCAVAEDDLSKIFFVNKAINPDTGTETMSLYLYTKGKAKLITDQLSDTHLIKDYMRLDRTRSYYVNINNGITENESQDN